MKISGLVKTSLIDYPGNIAAVVFTQGCNFRCGFCHNPDLIPLKAPNLEIPEKEVLEYLKERKKVLDGVVITGGEPTIQKDLKEFIVKIKQLGLVVKLDTNGSDPKILKELISEKLIDYVAMDIKGPLERYPQICSYLNKEFIQQSVKIIVDSGLKHEFRTTVLPYFHQADDFDKIGKLIKGADKYVVQGFRPQITLDKKLQGEARFMPEELEIFATLVRKYVKDVSVHANY